MKNRKQVLDHDEHLIGRIAKVDKKLVVPDITGKMQLTLNPQATFIVEGFHDGGATLLRGIGEENGVTKEFVAVIKKRGVLTLLPDQRRKFTSARALIMDGEKILVGLCRPQSYQAGKWELPGGRVEDCETLPATLIRECLEEIGVHVIPSDEMHQCVEYGVQLIIEHHIFKANILSGEPKNLQYPQLKWLTKKELSEVPLTVALRKLVESGKI